MTSASVLQFVFGTCAAGAVVLTVNVVLLGGNIGFFQSMCLLGYCLFPMDVAAIVTACTTNMIARWIVVLVRNSTCSLLLHRRILAIRVDNCGLPMGSQRQCMHRQRDLATLFVLMRHLPVALKHGSNILPECGMPVQTTSIFC